MKRIVYWGLAGTLLVSLGGIAAAQSNSAAPSSQSNAAPTESLGDYARQLRKEKKPDPAGMKSFNNDNLPKNDALSVVGPPSDASQDNANNASPDQAQQKQQPPAPTNDEWKGKIADQQSQIDLLSRELSVLQGEYKLRAAAFYADAGARLRDQGAWDKEDADYKQKIADKQKQLDDAKKALDDMQEQARKAGVPPGDRE